MGNPRHGEDVCTNYTMFVVDMMARCMAISETSPLFIGFEEKVIDSLMNVFLNLDEKNRSIWHRVLCAQSLLQFFDIVSRKTIMNPDECENIFYSQQRAPKRLQYYVPKLCETIINKQVKTKSVRFSTGIVSKSLGQIKLNCLDLLTLKVWSELANMCFVHNQNNMFLGHFRHLLQTSMVFRRRYLKHLFVSEKLLERFVDFYTKQQPKSALHGYILNILDDMSRHEQREDDQEENENIDNDIKEKKNYSLDERDQWNIVEFFNANDAWNEFAETVSTQIEAQCSSDIQVPHIADNEEELDMLLQSLLGDLNEPIIIQASDQSDD